MSHSIPETRKFSEVSILPAEVKESWLKVTFKYIKNLINNKTFIMDYPEKGDPVTPCMDVYKAKIKSDGSPNKLKLIIVVRGELNNKEMIVYTWYPKESMGNLKYFLEEDSRHK